jgi:hypothetical protein
MTEIVLSGSAIIVRRSRNSSIILQCLSSDAKTPTFKYNERRSLRSVKWADDACLRLGSTEVEA